MRGALFVAAVVIIIGWSLRVAGQGGVQNSSVAATGTSAISGVVKDGVSGRPIPAAVVALRLNTGAPLARIVRQLTDALGRFVFQDLPAASGYQINVTRVGFVEGGYGQMTLFGPIGRIALTEGQWFDQADVRLWKPGSITGRVLDENGDPVVGIFVRVFARQLVAGNPRLLAGSVAKTDDRGEYRLGRLPPGQYLVNVPSVQSTMPADLTTNAAGSTMAATRALEMQLRGASVPTSPRLDAALDFDPSNRLVVGTYATPPPVNGRPLAYPTTFFPGGSSPGDATAIELGLAEERRGIDIVLQPAPSARIAGRLDGPIEQGAGLLLRLMPAGLEELAGGGEAATTVVGQDGRFVFLNVPAGSYTIDARRATTELTQESGSGGLQLPSPVGATDGGSQSGTVASGAPGTGFVTRGGSTPDAFWTRTPVTVADADVNNLVVPLRRSLSMSGRMVFEGTARTIALASQASAAGVGSIAPGRTAIVAPPAPPAVLPTVYAEPANGDPSLGVPRSNRTDADDGSGDAFTLDGLKGGEYVLRVPQSGTTYAVKSITMAGRDVTNRPIDASGTQDLTDVVITFTDKITTLTGFVQGDLAVVTEAAVIAFPVEKEQWTRYGYTPMRFKAVTMVAATGYRIEGLPAGEYFVAAVEPALITAWQDPKLLESAALVATRVRIEWADTRAVDLKMVKIK